MGIEIIIYFIVGAMLGSFSGALTYRWPREESIRNGRSKCPHCKHQIKAYDNIPLLSYLILSGKCRHCHTEISSRYWIIEFGLGFLFTVFAFFNIATPLNLAIVFITYCIFIIDFEFQYIPDTLTFIGTFLVLLLLTLHPSDMYIYLASGLSAATFLLLINILTFGKGMGLGDVKLALFIGMLLGYPNTITWMFGSFVLGSIIGLILILFNMRKFKQRIAFGPFLVASLYAMMLFGSKLTAMIFPTVWF